MRLRTLILMVATVTFSSTVAMAQAQAPGGDADVEEKLRAAEARLAEAARQVAELSTRSLPHLERIERRIELVADGRPRLGVTIGGGSDGPVEGVEIIAVTPGSAAGEAGLRSGDTLTSINGESLGADSEKKANEKLVDFMGGIEDGDVVTVEYLRDGKVGSVEVRPKRMDVNVFAFRGDGPHVLGGRHPGVPLDHDFAFFWGGQGWGDMELVELNAGLGKYFGTDTGLLVVRAPASDSLKLEDGDVIQKIDGREPQSVRHAMRILGSYQAGERLELEIMRDKKRRKLDVEIPASQSSGFLRRMAPSVRPARMPKPPRSPQVLEKT